MYRTFRDLNVSGLNTEDNLLESVTLKVLCTYVCWFVHINIKQVHMYLHLQGSILTNVIVMYGTREKLSFCKKRLCEECCESTGINL